MSVGEAFEHYAVAYKRSIVLYQQAVVLGAAGREDDAKALMLRRATAATEAMRLRKLMDAALADEARREMRA